MPTIRQLSPSVVNKIAAGEVIERPASVVKELLENSLDAEATRVDVVVEKGGADLIRITDNGCGIRADQMQLAVASHATSKIADAKDLFHVETLGFRGEALASIASVSRLMLRSRPADCEAGAELEVVGGRVEPIRPVGCSLGTAVEIRQLFFNTPVRHKFLRTTSTEMGHITEAVTRLALAHPEVHFSLTHSGRQVHDLPPVEDPRERVAVLFGQEMADGLIEIDNRDDVIRLQGYVANPSQSRGNNRWQYLFLNGRHIRDRSLQHALSEAYRGLLLTGRHPICFLHLEIPPSTVDVNVHPTKLEVRFQDSGAIYSQLLGALRAKFLTTDLVAQGTVPEQSTTTDSESETAHVKLDASELFDWAKRQLGGPHRQEFSSGDLDSRGLPRSGSAGSLHLHDVSLPTVGHDAPPVPSSLSAIEDKIEFGERSRLEPPVECVPVPHGPQPALQIHNRYLVVETEEGLEVIDQHALHERILYETLRDKVLGGAIESQRLLVPEPVDLASSETAAIIENREILRLLGLEVESFGGDTILVSAYPAMLSNFSPLDVVQSLAEQLQNEGNQTESRDLLDDLMHRIACKAAVKYGDRLTSEEVNALLQQRHLAQDHHHCPHGRPTTLVFTCQQLDRQFKRI